MTFKSLTLPLLTLLLVSQRAFAEETHTYRVLKDGQGDYPTIQKAIDQAPEGSVIEIGPGEWTEQILIKHPVTLKGAGPDQTTLLPSPEEFPRPRQELFDVLRPIMKKLDRETRDKVTKAYLETYENYSVLAVEKASDVVIEDLSIISPNSTMREGLSDNSVVKITDASVKFNHIVIRESSGRGIACEGSSHVQINNSLVTNCWNRGIVIHISESGSFEITDSEIRNNRYAGISIGSPSPKIKVHHCLIHGAGWHGIRYDNSSPVISNNLLYSTAVSGIYASGQTKATVKSNLFYHSGISCWFENHDTIESNTFIGDHLSEEKSGITQGLQILGSSLPLIKKNLFVTCENAIYQGMINSKAHSAMPSESLKPESNVFWKNEKNLALFDQQTKETVPAKLPEGNRDEQPKFVNPEEKDYQLVKDSELFESGIGASDFASFKSSWPVQKEEDKTIEAVNARLHQTSRAR